MSGMTEPEQSSVVGDPRPGEQWTHKGTGRVVRVMFCVGAGPFGSPRQVRWLDENGQGKDSMPSFLDRFERCS